MWHLLHCLLIPELVVAAIEVVVVEAVEVILVVVPQLLVDEVELNSNAWVELVRVLVVAQEEHITDNGKLYTTLIREDSIEQRSLSTA